MVDITCKLDDLSLACPNQQLNLVIAASVDFHCPLELAIRDSDALSRALLERRIWASRGSNCCLRVAAELNSQPLEGQDRTGLLKMVAAVFSVGPLWKQLSLCPTLALVGNPDCSRMMEGDLMFELKPSLPSLGTDEAFQPENSDRSAPAGVPSVEQQSVRLVLSYQSPSTPQKRPKLQSKHFEKPICVVAIPKDACPYPKDAVRRVQGQFPDGSHVSETTDFGPEEFGEVQWQEIDHALAKEPLLYHNNSTHTSLTRDNPVGGYLPSPDSSQPRTAGFVSPIYPPLNPLVDYTTAADLFELGLRTLIGGLQTDSIKHIRVLKPRPSYSLSDLIPSIWSPGFMQGLEQRVCFLPTITAAFSSMSRNVQSPLLRKKLEKMQSAMQIKETGSGTRGGSEIPTSRSHALQASVFRVMQQKLHNPKAARRLLPSTVQGIPSALTNIVLAGTEMTTHRSLNPDPDDEMISFSDEDDQESAAADNFVDLFADDVATPQAGEDDFVPLFDSDVEDQCQLNFEDELDGFASLLDSDAEMSCPPDGEMLLEEEGAEAINEWPYLEVWREEAVCDASESEMLF